MAFTRPSSVISTVSRAEPLWPDHCCRREERCTASPVITILCSGHVQGLRPYTSHGPNGASLSLPWVCERLGSHQTPEPKGMTWVAFVTGHPRSRAGREPRWAFGKASVCSACPPQTGSSGPPLLSPQLLQKLQAQFSPNCRSIYDTLFKTLTTTQ